MTLAGTRPILQDELQKYELHHRARIAIKPGITGMWQVSGRSDITDFEEVVRLDTEYISNWNFGLDIKILFKENRLFGRNLDELEDTLGVKFWEENGQTHTLWSAALYQESDAYLLF